MSHQFCPECGHQNPITARYCMECGSPLGTTSGPVQDNGPLQTIDQGAIPESQSNGRGTDWVAIAAAFLAFLSLRHLSRRARGTALVILFLALFFGCPMVCGFVAYVMEWFARLFT